MAFQLIQTASAYVGHDQKTNDDLATAFEQIDSIAQTGRVVGMDGLFKRLTGAEELRRVVTHGDVRDDDLVGHASPRFDAFLAAAKDLMECRTGAPRRGKGVDEACRESLKRLNGIAESLITDINTPEPVGELGRLIYAMATHATPLTLQAAQDVTGLKNLKFTMQDYALEPDVYTTVMEIRQQSSSRAPSE